MEALRVAQEAMAARGAPEDREASQALDRLRPVIGHVEDAHALLTRMWEAIERG